MRVSGVKVKVKHLVLAAREVVHLAVGNSVQPHGGLWAFNQRQLARTQFTLKPHAVRIWSRYSQKSGGNETFVVHRVLGVGYLILAAGEVVDFAVGGSDVQFPVPNRNPTHLGLRLKG